MVSQITDMHTFVRPGIKQVNEEGFERMADVNAKNHDYHLVDPSPWPLVASISAFCIAVGLIFWIKDLPIGGLKFGSLIFGAGVVLLLYTLASWWGDVINEAQHGEIHNPIVQLGLRYGMILFIASEVMFFVAWFWAYFNSSLFVNVAIEHTRQQVLGGIWPPKGIEVIDPFRLPLLNTLILLTSGTTLTWAHHSLISRDNRGTVAGLLVTVVLGAVFTSVQAYEYIHAPFAFKNSIYGSTFYMATGFHGFHVIVGTLFLTVCLVRAWLNQFTPRQHLGFEFAAWYWHFVDVVWLFLFAVIYVWGSWGAPIETMVN